MAKRRARKQRPVRREAVTAHAVAELQPRMGPSESLWRYTLTVPLEEIKPQKRRIATADDLRVLQEMFVDHFGGFTRLPNSPGYGRRDPANPIEAPQMNYNAYFAVLSSPIPEAETYFRSLRQELQEALLEGVILVERLEVWIP